MKKVFAKRFSHQRRKKRVRKKVWGTSERPRLSVYRSIRHMQAQLIDDTQGRTVLGVSTLDPEIRSKIKAGGNRKAAEELGVLLAKKAKEAGIAKVVFDRSGYAFHGRIKALAEKIREGGLQL